jgi:hypothetical protein
MVTKLQTVLQASANVVIAQGEEVVLTANLSDLELENIRAQNGHLEHFVDGEKLKENPNDPRSATWTFKGAAGARGAAGAGQHRATVELFMPDRPPRTIGETTIYAVSGMKELQLEVAPPEVEEGELIELEVVGGPTPASLRAANLHYQWVAGNKGTIEPDEFNTAEWDTTGISAGTHSVTAQLVNESGTVMVSAGGPISVTGSARIKGLPLSRGDVLRVALQRPAAARTRDQAFWSLIRSCTAQIGASRYADFIEQVLCPEEASFVGRRPVVVSRLSRDARDLQTFTYGVGAYEVLKTATQIFLLLECGGCHAEIKDLDIDDESARFGEPVTLEELRQRLSEYLTSGHLPYIDRVLENAFRGEKQVTGMHCYGVLSSRSQVPCLLELIWSYWHEEGMVVQSINAIARRFQNVRAPGDRDPLAHLEIDPLRPLSNLLWGYIQDEKNLLTVKRRAYEYDHQYGLALYGKAVPALRPADSRSKFLEAFHHLLHRCSLFYKEDNDTTVIADGFSLLNALKEVHLLLAEGANNQFGDLPWTARAEMLIQQWLLSRPEMRDFLQGRRMVPYKEPWMAQVDTMKSLQGWTDIPVTHFRDLGVFGEQILLTIRYGDWIDVNNEDAAKNWARSWRPEIQGYLHAYRAVTGMDLTKPDMVDHTMPGIHLRKRLAMQRSR